MNNNEQNVIVFFIVVLISLPSILYLCVFLLLQCVCVFCNSVNFCECTAGTVTLSVALISTVHAQVQWNPKSA